MVNLIQNGSRFDCLRDNTQSNSYKHIKKKYENVFGKINKNFFVPDELIINALLKFANVQPSMDIDYGFCNGNSKERRKWKRENKNKFDEKIQEEYKISNFLLENTQPTSILQLKSLLISFWHVNNKIKEYINIKSTNSISLKKNETFLEKPTTIFAKIGNIGEYDILVLYHQKVYKYIRDISRGNKYDYRSDWDHYPIDSFNYRERINNTSPSWCYGNIIIKKVGTKEILSIEKKGRYTAPITIGRQVPGSTFKIGKSLFERATKTVAKIGNFILNGKDYEVIAYHLLTDEIKPLSFWQNEEQEFQSWTFGTTRIQIIEKDTFNSNNIKYMFLICIGRQDANNKNDFWSESYCDHKKKPVLDSERYLLVENRLYFDRTKYAEGSNKELNVMVTRVMAEMLMQNNAISLKVSSGHDDLAVLVAGGFTCTNPKSRQKIVTDDIDSFRKKSNFLFPPYKNYNSVNTELRKSDFEKKNVFLSKEGNESWNEIIERDPILKPGAGILPEYWVYPPIIAK